jgi:hypothetical protein
MEKHIVRWLVLVITMASTFATVAATTPVLSQQRPLDPQLSAAVAATDSRPTPAPVVGRRDPEDCRATCEFSSWGSADLHAFDHGGAGVLHVLYLEARWTKPQVRRLRRHADAWQQKVTLRAAQAGTDRPIVVEHSASDLPASRVDLIAGARPVTFTVTMSSPEKVRAGHLYRTQVLVRAPHDLDGSVWHYSEHIDHHGPDREADGFTADASSTPRRGTSGWCSQCFVVWDVAPAKGDR